MDPSTIYTKESFVAFCLVSVGLFLAWMVRTLMGVGIKTIDKVGSNIEANTSTLLSIASSAQRVETKVDSYGSKLDDHGRQLALQLALHGEHLSEIKERLGDKQA